MKTVVSLQDLLDFEIRPGALSEEFQTLTRSSVAELLRGPLAEVPCPACGRDASAAVFEKIGATYCRCTECATLFVSPRPAADALARYANSSPAAQFWRERILAATRDARLEKLIRPRADWVVEALAKYRPGSTTGVDISPQGQAFVDALKAASPAITATASDAHSGQWGKAGTADFVTAFDVLDRAADVRALVASVHTTLRPNGLFFVTAPSVTGFDLQVLADRSATIMPPDKLNVLSIAGFARLFASPAWEVIELSTPGMFDVENVRRAILAEPDANWPAGVREIVLQEDADARLEFQEYLQRHRLASFARLVVRRVG